MGKWCGTISVTLRGEMTTEVAKQYALDRPMSHPCQRRPKMSRFRQLKMSHSGGTSLGRPGLLAGPAAAGGSGFLGVEQLLEVGVLAHPVAAPADV